MTQKVVIPLTILFLIIIFFSTNGAISTFDFEPLNYLANNFVHADLSHLLTNAIGLWQLKNLSQNMSQIKILKLMIIIWFLSTFILYLFHYLFPQVKKQTIGFSGIVLGLIIISEYLDSGKLFNVTRNNLLLILPHFFIPDISFLGHLAGVISGVIVSSFM